MSDESTTTRNLPAWALLAGVTLLAVGTRALIALAERSEVFERSKELSASSIAAAALAAAIGTFIGRRWINRPSALLLGAVFGGILTLLLAGSSNIIVGLGVGLVVGAIGICAHNSKRIVMAAVVATVAGLAAILVAPAENPLVWGGLGGIFASVVYGFRIPQRQTSGWKPRLAFAVRALAILFMAMLAAWWGSLAPTRAIIAKVKSSGSYVGFQSLPKGSPLRAMRKELELSGLIPVTSIYVSMTEPDQRFVAGLGRLTALEDLELADTALDEQALAGLARAPALTTLRLSRCQVADNAWDQLARAQRLSSLTLDHTQIEIDGVAALASMPTLAALSLHDSGADATALNALAAHTGLTDLTLTGPTVTGEYLLLLDRLPTIVRLSLSNWSGDAAKFPTLAAPPAGKASDWPEVQAVRNARYLKSLQLVLPLDAGLRQGLVRETPNLSRLEIVRTGTFHPDAKDPDGPMVYADLSNSGVLADLHLLLQPRQELRSVDLSGCELEAGDVALFTKLPKLETLTLDRAMLPYDALRELAAAPLLSSVSLRMLRTDWSPALKAAEFPRWPALRELDLAYNSIDDDALANLGALPNLRSLNLKGNPLTDAAVAHLMGMTSLERLDLRETQVTPAGVQAMRQRLPKAKIRSDE